jgi:hypothetical protein
LILLFIFLQYFFSRYVKRWQAAKETRELFAKARKECTLASHPAYYIDSVAVVNEAIAATVETRWIVFTFLKGELVVTAAELFGLCERKNPMCLPQSMLEHPGLFRLQSEAIRRREQLRTVSRRNEIASDNPYNLMTEAQAFFRFPFARAWKADIHQLALNQLGQSGTPQYFLEALDLMHSLNHTYKDEVKRSRPSPQFNGAPADAPVPPGDFGVSVSAAPVLAAGLASPGGVCVPHTPEFRRTHRPRARSLAAKRLRAKGHRGWERMSAVDAMEARLGVPEEDAAALLHAIADADEARLQAARAAADRLRAAFQAAARRLSGVPADPHRTFKSARTAGDPAHPALAPDCPAKEPAAGQQRKPTGTAPRLVPSLSLPVLQRSPTYESVPTSPVRTDAVRGWKTDRPAGSVGADDHSDAGVPATTRLGGTRRGARRKGKPALRIGPAWLDSEMTAVSLQRSEETRVRAAAEDEERRRQRRKQYEAAAEVQRRRVRVEQLRQAIVVQEAAALGLRNQIRRDTQIAAEGGAAARRRRAAAGEEGSSAEAAAEAAEVRRRGAAAEAVRAAEATLNAQVLRSMISILGFYICSGAQRSGALLNSILSRLASDMLGFDGPFSPPPAAGAGAGADAGRAGGRDGGAAGAPRRRRRRRRRMNAEWVEFMGGHDARQSGLEPYGRVFGGSDRSKSDRGPIAVFSDCAHNEGRRLRVRL